MLASTGAAGSDRCRPGGDVYSRYPLLSQSRRQTKASGSALSKDGLKGRALGNEPFAGKSPEMRPGGGNGGRANPQETTTGKPVRGATEYDAEFFTREKLVLELEKARVQILERDSLILQLRAASTENTASSADQGPIPAVSGSYGGGYRAPSIAAPSQLPHSYYSDNISTGAFPCDLEREAEQECLRHAMKRLIAEKQSLLEHISRSSTSTASLSTLLSESQQRHENLIARADQAVARAETLNEEAERLRAAHALQLNQAEEASRRNEELLARNAELERRLCEAVGDFERVKREADEETEKERREREILRREAEEKAEEAERAAEKIRKLYAEIETVEDRIRTIRSVVEAALDAANPEMGMEAKRDGRRQKLPSPALGCAAQIEDLSASVVRLSDGLRIFSANLRDRETRCQQAIDDKQALRDEVFQLKQALVDAETSGREEKERAVREEREKAAKSVQDVRDGIEEKVRVLTAEYDALQARFRKLSQATRIAEKARQELKSFDVRMKDEEKKHQEREAQLIAASEKKIKEALEDVNTQHAQDVLALKRDIESARARFRLMRNENARLRREMEELAGVLRDGGISMVTTDHATLETMSAFHRSQTTRGGSPATPPEQMQDFGGDFGINSWTDGMIATPGQPVTSDGGNARPRKCPSRRPSKAQPWLGDRDPAGFSANECGRGLPAPRRRSRQPEIPAGRELGNETNLHREFSDNGEYEKLGRRCSAGGPAHAAPSHLTAAPEMAVGKLKSIREQLRDLRNSIPRT